MRLLSNYINSGELKGSHNGRIDITSPEQFVPLHLATLYPLKNFSKYDTCDGEYCTIFDEDYRKLTKISGLNEEFKKQKIKLLLNKSIKDILKTEVVKSYTLSVSNTNFSITRVTNIFSGEANKTFCVGSNGSHYVGFGMFGRVAPIQDKVTLQSDLYPSITYHTEQVNNYTPYIQIIVKAKHLQYIRAKLYTNQNYSLPHSDIIILKAPHITDTYCRTINEKVLKQFITKEEVQVKYMPPEEIAKYLYKPLQKKTAEQTLEDLKYVMNHEEEFLSLV